MSTGAEKEPLILELTSASPGDLLWQKMLEDYLGTAEEEILQRASDKIRLLACVRFLQLLVSEPWDNQELHGLRIRHTLEHISELLPRVHTLELT